MILHRTEKRIVDSVVDLFLMETLIKVEDVNLLAIMSISTRLSLLRTASTEWNMGIC